MVTRINELGVEIQYTPGGCTGLCQPIDVGVAKPQKDELRNLWESWMIKEEVIPVGGLPRREQIDSVTTPTPKREQIATWTMAALQSISSQTVKNAWRHRDFGWFPAEF